jgi:hypothetical protein
MSPRVVSTLSPHDERLLTGTNLDGLPIRMVRFDAHRIAIPDLDVDVSREGMHFKSHAFLDVNRLIGRCAE